MLICMVPKPLLKPIKNKAVHSHASRAVERREILMLDPCGIAAIDVNVAGSSSIARTKEASVWNENDMAKSKRQLL